MKKTRKFHTRSFVSFFLLFNSIVMAVTGLILYFTPQGRLARWTDWSFMGMTKDQLEGIHTVSSFLFLAAAVIHVVVFNWRVIRGYLKHAGQRLNLRRLKYKTEFIAAVIFSLVIFLGTFYALPPFGNIVDWGDQLKNSWGDGQVEAPVPGAEKLSLDDFSKKVLKADVKVVIAYLKSKSLNVDHKEQIFKDVAARNECSPARLYELLKSGRLTAHP